MDIIFCLWRSLAPTKDILAHVVVLTRWTEINKFQKWGIGVRRFFPATISLKQ